jgi:putative glutathione S-transferase
METIVGQLVDGRWSTEWYDTAKTGGAFVRSEAPFRNWITPDGAAGPTGEGGFPAEAGRYHLYVSYACPWAHRTLIFRALKSLEDLITVSVVSPKMPDETGWSFKTDEGSTGDSLYGSEFLYNIYQKAKPDHTGRVTVPVLWDKQRLTIVSNESADIIRMFNSAFDGLTGNDDDYYPEALRPEIDAINKRVYDTVNNGVYKAGFATTQTAYEKAVLPLFATLDELDVRLANRRFLFGDALTETDIRLFTTGIRFDTVYFSHFKCNLRQWRDYPNLSRWLAEIYALQGIADTVDLAQIKRHYYFSQHWVNPTGIVPIGPTVDLTLPMC